ncbi:MAG: HD domain-containing protein [Candidatus Aceula lacicola]|nr:HD domain-containing protein [Candidatus Aceula lacicola]
MKSQNKKIKKVVKNQSKALDFFAEAGLLKRVKRSGWWVAGIKDPESVADHSFRCAIIAHYIAHLEGVDPYKATIMALFNDIHEARINDLHKMGHYYIDFKVAEKKVFSDQVKNLDKKVKEELSSFRKAYDQQKTKESLVARDADILECLLQAKEYMQNGHKKAEIFLKKAPGFLKTKSAKKMWNSLKKWDSAAWWQNVVKFER